MIMNKMKNVNDEQDEFSKIFCDFPIARDRLTDSTSVRGAKAHLEMFFGLMR